MTKKKDIFIISQHFYGNRTGTEIDLDRVDYFLRGHISREHSSPKDIADVDRRIVHIPGAEHIVVVYDQTQEDRYVNVEFPALYADMGEWYRNGAGKEMTMHISCEIPEIGFRIHTRCFACRMDDSGNLHSLEENDYQQFIHYFPVR